MDEDVMSCGDSSGSSQLAFVPTAMTKEGQGA